MESDVKAALIGFVMFVLGTGFGSCCAFSASTRVKYDTAVKELRERCCSCTQTELGSCGRR